MRPSTEADLVWRFGIGAAAFERSPEGARLELAEQFGSTSDGVRVEHPQELANRVWAARQRACNRQAQSIPQELADELRELLAGTQPDESLDAQPTHTGGGESAGYEPDHATLQKFAKISRALQYCSIQQQRALEAFHGEEGARWERSGVRPGAIIVVMTLTAAGQRALGARFARLKAGDEGSPASRMAAELQLQVTAPTQSRKQLLESAEHQARALLAEAHRRFEERM